MGHATYEQEIMEAVRQLDVERQRRVLEFIRDLGESPMTLAEWLDRAQELQEELQARYGEGFVFDSQAVLDEIREERLDDIMGGS